MFPVADETNAEYAEPLNNCNLPPILIDCAIPAPPLTINAPVLIVVDAVLEVTDIPEE